MHKGIELAFKCVVGHAFEAAVRLSLGVFGRQGFTAKGARTQPSGCSCANGYVALDQLACGAELIDCRTILIAHPDVAILVLNDRFQIRAQGVVVEQVAIGVNGDLIALAIGAACDGSASIFLGELHFTHNGYNAASLIQRQLVEAGLIIGQQERLHGIRGAVGAWAAIGLHHILAAAVAIGAPVRR